MNIRNKYKYSKKYAIWLYGYNLSVNSFTIMAVGKPGRSQPPW